MIELVKQNNQIESVRTIVNLIKCTGRKSQHITLERKRKKNKQKLLFAKQHEKTLWNRERLYKIAATPVRDFRFASMWKWKEEKKHSVIIKERKKESR